MGFKDKTLDGPVPFKLGNTHFIVIFFTNTELGYSIFFWLCLHLVCPSFSYAVFLSYGTVNK